MSNWTADRDAGAFPPPLWLWSNLGPPLAADRIRASQSLRRLTPGSAGWGLGRGARSKFNLIASYVALAIECGAVFVVAFGALQAMAALLKAIANGQATGLEGRQIWLRFATWILLGLEFALAADILRTAVAPTWDDISKLAVIATIRTMLNYFLAKDIMAFDKSQKAGSEGAQPRQNRPEIREIKALLISWTLRRICGSVP